MMRPCFVLVSLLLVRLREMAGDHPPRFDFARDRRFDATMCGCQRTACAERAAGRGIENARDLAGESGLAFAFRIGPRNRVQERARIGMPGMAVDVTPRSPLDDAAR